jgi:hypothetical protein
MRSGLQPVAISCNKSFCHDPFAVLVDARARPENASDASNVLGMPISMQDRELRTIGVLRSSRLPISSSFEQRAFLASPSAEASRPLHGRPARRHSSGVVPWERLKDLTK